MKKEEEKMRKSYEDDWEKISAEIHLMQPSVRDGGICYPIFYQGIKIARLYCSGAVDFINQKKWKKSWTFDFNYGEDYQKFFYRYVGK